MLGARGLHASELCRPGARLICVSVFPIEPAKLHSWSEENRWISSPSYPSPSSSHQTTMNTEDSNTLQPHDENLNDQAQDDGQLPATSAATSTPPSSSQDDSAATANGSTGNPNSNFNKMMRRVEERLLHDLALAPPGPLAALLAQVRLSASTARPT